MSGPLTGTRVLELASIGPGPFAAMMLADLGADVLRIDRSPSAAALFDLDAPLMGRGRRSVAVDLKHRDGVGLVEDLLDSADVLIEGFRPGVAERIGLGPEECLSRNPRLVYGRVTGWGQDGPLATAAGHDINYIGLTGALAAMGSRQRSPAPPLNLVGDFGGGGMLLVVGILAALVERMSSDRGQVVDAAMVDGAALLMTMFFEMRSAGAWDLERESNLLDGGAPFYDTYQTADGGYMSVGPLEPQFFREFVAVLDIDFDPVHQHDRDRWPELRDLVRSAFAQRTRSEWEAAFADHDCCVAPVLSMDEAPLHAHNRARAVFEQGDQGWRPSAAPRFSRTPGRAGGPAARRGEHSRQALQDWGVSDARIDALLDSGAVIQAGSPA